MRVSSSESSADDHHCKSKKQSTKVNFFHLWKPGRKRNQTQNNVMKIEGDYWRGG
jgi:hypothetical protein